MISHCTVQRLIKCDGFPVKKTLNCYLLSWQTAFKKCRISLPTSRLSVQQHRGTNDKKNHKYVKDKAIIKSVSFKNHKGEDDILNRVLMQIPWLIFSQETLWRLFD